MPPAPKVNQVPQEQVPLAQQALQEQTAKTVQTAPTELMDKMAKTAAPVPQGLKVLLGQPGHKVTQALPARLVQQVQPEPRVRLVLLEQAHQEWLAPQERPALKEPLAQRVAKEPQVPQAKVCRLAGRLAKCWRNLRMRTMPRSG